MKKLNTMGSNSLEKVEFQAKPSTVTTEKNSSPSDVAIELSLEWIVQEKDEEICTIGRIHQEFIKNSTGIPICFRYQADSML